MFSRFGAWWQTLQPVTRAAIFWVPIVCLGVNVSLPNLPWQSQQTTALDYTSAWLSGIAHHDSWRPMRMALAHQRGIDLDTLQEDGSLPPDVLAGSGAGEKRGAVQRDAERNRAVNESAGLYQEIFFEREVKLQYPPTSLLFLAGLERLPRFTGSHSDPTSDEALNAVSWLAVLLSALLAAGVLVAAATTFSDRAASLTVPERLLLALLALVASVTFYPLVRGYYLGQIQTLIDALVGGLVLAFVLGRQATAGVLAGLICVIKPQLGILVLWAVLRGRWRFVFGWGVIAVGAGCASLYVYGLDTHFGYLEVLEFIGRHGEGFHPNQSVNGLLNRALGIGNNLQWEGQFFAPFDARVYWATLASSLLLVGLALFYRRSEHSAAPSLDLMIAIVSVTIASPVAWTHHYGALLPVFALAVPAAFAANRSGRLGRSGFLLLGVSYLLIADNFRALNRLADTPFNFLQSYVFFGGLLLLVLLYRVRHRLADDLAEATPEAVRP